MINRKLSALILMIVLIILIALMLTAYARVNVGSNTNSTGSIAFSSNIRVYSNSACTVPLTTLNWGSPFVGGTVTKTVYIKNTQGTASLTLSMTTCNWSPTNANGPLTITWNKQGAVIAPRQSIAATITLTVSASITGITTFSNQISISGTG